GIEVTAQAVHEAVESGDVANLALLKTAAAPFDTTDPQGLTPLMVAVEAKQEAALNLLLKHRKVDADARDKQGFTALSHALMTDQLEMAKSLIRHTKNPNVILANEGKPLPALLKTVQDQSQAKVEILLSHA